MKQAFERFMKAIDIDQFNQMKSSEWGKDTSYINILHLFIIGHSKQITLSELADKLGLSRPAVTQKINELERQGLIKKVKSDRDKRYSYISLSDKIMESAQSTRTASVLEAVNEYFSEDKLEVFTEILTFMANYIEEGEK